MQGCGNRSGRQVDGWDLLDETKSVLPWSARFVKCHNFIGVIILTTTNAPSIFSSRSLGSGRREWIKFYKCSFCHCRSGRREWTQFPGLLFLSLLHDKEKKVRSQWRIASYICAFNALSWLSDCHVAGPIGVCDVLATADWGFEICTTVWIFHWRWKSNRLFQSHYGDDVSTWFKKRGTLCKSQNLSNSWIIYLFGFFLLSPTFAS